MIETKWLKFEMIDQKPKTQVWNVVSKRDGTSLGLIDWYSPWRQYVFSPVANSVFAGSCFDDISKFMRDLMTRHKARSGW